MADRRATFASAETVPRVPRFLTGGGEMGALMRYVDWRDTPLGPVTSWPQSLRTALSILLDSQFPKMIMWGPQLVQFYNDAYRPILGTLKHPAAMGQPARECWPEIWPMIGPMFERVMEHGEAVARVDELFVLDRNGYLEETYFTFCYSPIRDETGGVGGSLITCFDTTHRVFGERQVHLLNQLAIAAATASADDEQDLFPRLVTMIDGHPDAPVAHRVSVTDRVHLGPEMPAALRVAVRDVAPNLVSRAAGGVQLEVLDLGTPPLVVPGQPAAITHAALVTIPSRGMVERSEALVIGLNPRRPFDETYRAFLGHVAGQVGAALANARSHSAERRRAALSLQAEQTLVQRLLETSPAGVLRVDQAGSITFANPRAEEVLGLPREAITARRYDDPAWQLTAADGAALRDDELPFERVRDTLAPVNDARHAILRPDGHRAILRVNAAPLLTPEGAFDGIVATVEDITSAERATAALGGLRRLTLRLGATLDLEEVVEVLLEEAIALVEAEGGWAALHMPGTLECTRHRWATTMIRLDTVPDLPRVSPADAADSDPRRAAGAALPWPVAGPEVRSTLHVQLRDPQGASVGVLVLGNRTGEEEFTREDVDLMSAIGQAATLALGNAIAYRRLAQSNASLELLQSVAVAANLARDPEDALRLCLGAMCEHTGWEVGHAFWHREDGDGHLVPSGVWVTRDIERFDAFRRASEALTFRVGNGLPGRVARTGVTEVIQPLDQPELFARADAARHAGLQAGIAVPVLIGSTVAAVLECYAVRPIRPDKVLLELTAQVGAQLGRVLERQRATDALTESRERLKQLSKRLLDVQESERRALAHELHDEVGQVLTALKLDLSSLGRAGEAQRHALLEECERLADQTLDRVRNLSLDLRPSLLDDLGLAAAIRWFADRTGSRSNLRIRVQLELTGRRMPGVIESSCYRVVQEAMTNIVRHARATSVTIELRQASDQLCLRVSDDGVGFDVATARRDAVRGRSLGLLGMQERTALLDGSLEIVAGEGCGTSILARWPLP